RELKAFGLPGLGPSNFGTTQAGKGIMTYSWFDANVQGVSKADGETLYEACFDVVGKTGSKATLSFANEPTIIEITNSASQFLDLQGQSGEATIR
ncbi:MAG: hypothetical protein GW795_07945, partial [Cyanobacteria bacterium]|nr:hypothetical protein [Cyanobacteria bacterium CG_2015-04_32_10]